MGMVGAATLSVIAVFGLLVGSFLNVVIFRLPRECLSVVRQTRSRCPRCAVQLAWYDNIPVLSYVVLLRGQCRHCKKPISFRYPAVELLTCLCVVALAWHALGADGLEHPLDEAAPWLVWAVHVVVVSALIALSVIDLDYRILPDAITLPGIVAAPVLVFVAPGAAPDPVWQPLEGGWADRWNALLNGIAGIGLGAGLLYGIGWAGSKVFRKPAMGLGDVKLFAAMGGFLGLWVPLVLIVASFAGSVIGIIVVLVKKDRYVPFGPFLAAGFVITMLWGPELLARLWTWLGP